MPALILPLKKQSRMKPCPPRHLRGVPVHCPTPNAPITPPLPSQLKINSNNVKTIPLNCSCIISCRCRCQSAVQCAVARVTRRMLLCCHSHPREPCQARAPAAGLALTPSSPGAASPWQAAPPALHSHSCTAGTDGCRVLEQLPSNVQHRQTLVARGLGYAGSLSLMRKENNLHRHLGIVFFWWFPICLLLSPHTLSTLTEGCIMSAGLHGPCLHNFNLKKHY